MNPTAAEKIALDNTLFAPEAQLTIVNKVQGSSSNRFKIDNKFKVDVEVFCNILQICLKLPDQPFDIPPFTDEEIVCLVGITTGEAFVLLRIHYPKKARKFKKPASPKLKTVLVSPKEPKKKPAKKTKAPAKGKRSRCIEILFDVALSETALLKEATKRSKKDFHISQASGSGDGVGSQPKFPDESEDKTTGTYEGTGTIPGVPDLPKYQSESDDESWDDIEDDDNDDDSDDVSKGDDDKADSNDDEEEHDEEYVQSLEKYESDDDKENIDEEEYDDLYKDVDEKSLRAEHEKEGKGDAEMTDADQDVSQEKSNEQVVEDAHEESSTQAPPLPTVPMTAILETSTVAATTIPPLIQPFSSISQMTTPTPEPTTKPTTTSIAALLNFSSLFGFDQRVSTLEKEMSQFKQANHSAQLLEYSYTKEFEKKAQEQRKLYIDVIEKSVKDIIKDEVKSQLPQILPKEVSEFATLRGRKDKDKDEDPLEEPVFETGNTKMPQDQGDDMSNTDDQPNIEEDSKHDWFKKPERTPTPDRDWNARKQIDFRPHQTWINKIAKAGKPPTTFDDLMSTPIDFSAYVLHNLKIENLTQEHLVGPTFSLLKGTCKIRVELEFHFEECYKDVIDKLDWTKPEGHEYPFHLRKPIPFIEDQGRQVVPASYFFNNDLKYLKGGSLSRKYTTSTTKTKATKVLQDIASSLEMDYLPKRRRSKIDRKRSRIMIKAIDHRLFERRLMRNLEKFVGGREYRIDFMLLERTI
nr:hypothetical protein [Tanacetum cinerariifolium]